jgi:hypothetical protein
VKTRKEPCLTLLNAIISLVTGLALAFGTYRRLGLPKARFPGIDAACATAPADAGRLSGEMGRDPGEMGRGFPGGHEAG